MSPRMAALTRACADFDAMRALRAGLLVLLCLWLTVAVLFPLATLAVKSLTTPDGAFAGFDNFIRYFSTPSLAVSFGNSLFVSAATTLVAVSLGFAYAYALTRTAIPAKGFFLTVAMMPLFAPTLLNGIVLVYLFGKKGLVTTGFFGILPFGLDIGLYGAVGIILAEVLFVFPQAVLILTMALSMTDARLYEAAHSLGASPGRVFFTVTLPGVRYGLVSACFVGFILSFTDFGAPKVVGGFFNVLATDIYKQVIGQQNFVMGATVSMILLFPTVLAFLADRVSRRRQSSMIGARSVPLVPRPDPVRDRPFFLFCLLVALAVISFFLVAVFASLIKVWPYDLSLTLAHYDFSGTGGGGYRAFFNSLKMSAISAVAGTVATFSAAYLIEKSPGMRPIRQAASFLCIVPLALPGLVIGLSYIFFFNAPAFDLFGLHIPNPANALYATMGILVLSNVVHFFTVGYLTAATALGQLDREFESVSESMGVPFYRTFLRVTAPVCLPAILEIGLYFFVNSMATVSAVIFLYSADIPLAAVAVANMDDAGDIAPACAMSVLIVGANVAVRILYGLATKRLRRRTQTWAGKG
ncbi:putative 2-aminoethylphosphonate ABC transporter permease subunit [Desulfolutivibrio sp.]|uniref:putative 2-aminoethylphosphonate ABC transporter permease subunit n=1 Tax=Desulfolutivibrio sp. TaxID=2773296 RepID=UPI002F96916B